MAWGSLSWLRATPETTYGVYDSSQAANAKWFRLAGDTAFDGMTEVMRHVIRSADSGNRPVQNISSRTKVAAKLKTPAYPTQLAAILGWATTLTSNDLASWTFDYYDSVEATRLLGGKCETLSAACAAETDEGKLMLDLGISFQRVDASAPTLAQPTGSVFPAENPYTFFESSTGFTIGGAVRTLYNQFKWDLKNIIKPQWDELPYISALPYCGRDHTFSSNYRYVNTTDRGLYEGQAGQTCSIVFTRVGTPNKVLTLDWKGACRVAKRSRTTPLGDVARQGFDYEAFVDPSAGYVDFSFSQT